MINEIKETLKSYAKLASASLNSDLTSEEKADILDALNKVAETNSIIAQILKGNQKPDIYRELLEKQFKEWEGGKKTLVEFKNLYR